MNKWTNKYILSTRKKYPNWLKPGLFKVEDCQAILFEHLPGYWKIFAKTGSELHNCSPFVLKADQRPNIEDFYWKEIDEKEASKLKFLWEL